jgi:hypothetical protein
MATFARRVVTLPVLPSSGVLTFCSQMWTLPEFGPAITQLREVLGEQTYQANARRGDAMTTTAMVNYAYDQIDQARAELNARS